MFIRIKNWKSVFLGIFLPIPECNIYIFLFYLETSK